MNNNKSLINLLGTPFQENEISVLDEEIFLSIYESSFKDRVALLLLDKYRQSDWGAELTEKFETLYNRQIQTFNVISRLADLLNKYDENSYVIFKSIKPYPATPNDTDVLFMGGKQDYEKAYQYLLDSGYLFHEWAPQQRTLYDPSGVGKIGKGKKGGTYYIDCYEEISTDYFAYFNKNKLKPFIIKKEVNGISVNLLRPEPELAIILFHNVFPERTFQLEHFYLPLYYLSEEDFDIDLFTDFIKKNKMVNAVRANLSIVALLHNRNFGFVPNPVKKILQSIGDNSFETARFQKSGATTPYMFSPRVFWVSFLEKATEFYCFKSLMVQFFRMLNPVFFYDVARSLKNRFSERGVYHPE